MPVPAMCNAHARKATWLVMVDCLMAAGLALTAPGAMAQAEIVGIASVADGDTIEVHGQRIRVC